MLKVLGVMASLFLAACGNPEGPSDTPARQVLRQYLDATAHANWSAAYDHVSAADKVRAQLPEFAAEAGKSSGIPPGQALVSYRVVDFTQAGDRATAQVELRVRETGQLRTSAPAHEPFNPGPGSHSGDAAVTWPQLQQFTLVRETGGWKVSLPPAVAAATRPSGAVTENEDTARGANAATLPHGEPVESDTAWSIAGRVLDAHAHEIAGGENTQAYLSKVQLYGLRAGYYRTSLGRRVPGVEFKLRNLGQRALAKVAVTVYFKDTHGTIICEETYYPVLVSGHSFLDSNPLKPNYIWQLESNKFFIADAVPTEWKQGAVEARVTDIGFIKSAG